jgi:prophage antirepressor-like protein
MVDIVIDIYDTILKYEGNEIMTIVDDDNMPWFSGSQLAKILGYMDTDDAIRRHVSSEYKMSLDNIIDDINKIFPNAKPNAIFVNEFGLYELIGSGHKEKSKKFRKWIYEEILPSLRKKGTYILHEQMKHKFDELNKELEEYKIKNKKLENNLKKNKFPEGGIIYIIQPIELEDDEQFKIGKTINMNKRKNTYNTTVPDNVKVLYTLKVDDPTAVELCIKGALYKYRYRDNKEYYNCPLNKIIKAIETCSNVVDEAICETCTIHKKEIELSRYKNESNEAVDFNEEDIYGLIFTSEGLENDIQTGGGNNEDYHYKYLKYAIKYTGLMMEKTNQLV